MKSKIFYTFLICIQTIALISCNQDSTINNNEKSEVITLPLKIDTENVSIIEEPFSRNSSNNDIYVIQVTYYPTGSNSLSPYAYGIFDNLENLSISLIKGYKYCIEAALYIDGKQQLYNYANWTTRVGFGEGRLTQVTNKFISEASYRTTPNSWYNIYTKDMNMYLNPPLEKYFGNLLDINPEEINSIDLSLLYFSSKVKWVVNNLKEGTVSITTNTGRNDAPYSIPNINLTPESNSYETFYMLGDAYYSTGDITRYCEEDAIHPSIVYKDKDGMETLLFNNGIKLKRKTNITIEVNLKDATETNSTKKNMTINLENKDFEDVLVQINQE